MNRTTHRLLAAALTLGAFSFTPTTFAKEKKDDRPQAAESEVQVKYASLSKPVKESLDKARGDREIKSIYRVERDGRVFFRATIDFKGADHHFRIAEDGGILGEAATDDTSKPEAPARNTGIVPPKARPAAVEEGTVVDFNKLSGPAKMGIAGQAKANRIKEVRRIGSGKNEVYKAEVGNDVRNWLITVDATGKVLSEVEDTDNSKLVASFDSLPGPVKVGVIREARGAKVGKVMQISRAKETYYRIELLTSPEPRWITVNDDGKAVDYPAK